MGGQAEQLDRSLAEQNKYQGMLRELLEAERNRRKTLFSRLWRFSRT